MTTKHLVLSNTTNCFTL